MEHRSKLWGAKLWAAWLGAGVGAFGLAVIVGFAGHVRALAQIQSGRDASMALSAALALLLAGLGLLAAALAARGDQRTDRRAGVLGGMTRSLAAAVVALGGLALTENLADVNLGLDWPRLHYWLADPAMRPGRMSLLAAIGLVCVGAALWLKARSGTRSRRSVWILSAAVAGVGAAGLIGYWLDIEAVFPFHGMSAMAIYAGAAFLALGAGLALLNLPAGLHQGWARAAPNVRILLVATVVMLLVVAGSGVSSLILLQHMSRQDAVTDLTLRRDERVHYIAALIDEARARGTQFTGSGLLVGLIAHPAAVRSPMTLPQQIHALRVRNPQGKVLVRFGLLVRPREQLPLPGSPPAELLWNNGFYLRQSIPTEVDGGRGEVIVEQPLPLLGSIGLNTAGWGKTGEMGVCGAPYPGSGSLECFPQRMAPFPYEMTPRRNGAERPMTLAIEGKSGVAMASDYRGKRVLSAYAPVPGTGLGLAVKMDTSELYGFVRRQIEIVVPVLVILIGLGVAMLRSQIRPLVEQLEMARNEAVRSEARFRAAAGSSPDGFYILESVRGRTGAIADFRLAFANKNGVRLAGISDRLEPPPISQIPRLAEGGFLARLAQVVGTGQPLDEEIRLGEAPETWLHRQAAALGDGAAVTLRDITERKRAEEQLRAQAQRDSLTGLANRHAFMARLRHAMAASRQLRNQSLLAVLFLDLDYFKQVNDTWGHDQGDLLLREVGQRLLTCVRASDTVARLGGDEYTVLLENLDDGADAERVVNCIFEALGPPVRLERTAVQVTFSIGVAYDWGEEADAEPEALLRRADKALYEAKRAGRNLYRVYAA